MPGFIENEMKQSRFIEQILVIGEGQKMPAALIQPNFQFLRDWAKIHHEPIPENNEDLILNTSVIARIQLEIDKGNEDISKQFELPPL